MTEHKVVDREEWQAAREELLEREKAHTRMGDELARQRRELPWVPVDKAYRFDTDQGPRTLAELFEGRSQLLVYHFMFGPSYEAGDPRHSSIADTLDGAPHLQARDVTLMCLPGAAGQAAGLQAADGLAPPLGLGGGQRLQLRPRPLRTEEQTREAFAPSSRRERRRSWTRTQPRAGPTSLATSPRPRS